MSLQEIQAGRAVVEATVKDKTDAGLKSAMGRLKAFGAGARAIGAGLTAVGAGFTAISSAILTPLGVAAKSFADSGSEIHDMAGMTGLAADNLSELKFAAEQSGASLSDVAVAIKSMQKAGFDASKFDEIAAGIASIKDPTERTKRALEVFGKSGTKLLPMLGELAALRQQARQFGAVISPEDAKAADALGDAFGAIKAALGGLKNQVGAAIAEPLTKAANAIAATIAGVSRFVQANRGLVVGLAITGVVLGTIGEVLLTLGTTFLTVGAAIAGVSALIGFLVTPIGVAVAVVSALTAALILAAAGWLIFTKSGQQAAESFGTFLGGIVDAIAAGNILNAWQQVAVGMQMIWLEMVKGVKQALWGMIQWIASSVAKAANTFADNLDALGLRGGDTIRKLSSFGKGLVNNAQQDSLATTAGALVAAQAGLNALRGQVASERAAIVASATASLGDSAEIASGLRGSSKGTFNAAAAGLLGQSGPANEQLKESKKTNTLLARMEELLGSIDDNTGDLEGPLAFE